MKLSRQTVEMTTSQKNGIRPVLAFFMVAGVLLLAGMHDSARAQDYPARPIRLIVTYASGGGADFVGRVVARKLSETWNHPVIVENRPGGGSNIGAELVARAAPDGYTLLLGTTSNTVNMTLYARPPYDIVKDFTPIAQISTAPNVLVVHPKVPARSVRELIALAKSRPGELNFASAGIGSSNHLSGELFRLMAGIDIVHVPYKGGSGAVTDLLGGVISMYFSTPPSSVPFLRSGKLRALAVTGAQRSAAVPDVPTVAESGLPGFENSAWHGVLAPSGTPQAIIAKLNSELVRIVRMPDVKAQLAIEGVDAVTNSPSAEFAAFIEQDVAKYAKLLKAAGIHIE